MPLQALRHALRLWAVGLGCLTTASLAALETSDNSTHITLSTAGLDIAFRKSDGKIMDVNLEGQDLLGPISGNTGLGPYLDCNCVPSGFWTPGSSAAPSIQLIQGTDATDTEYAAVVMSDTHASKVSLTQYFFLRDGETGLHAFTRLTYSDESTPRLRDLGEMRLLFRPNTDLWTHFSTSDGNYGPLPGGGSGSVTVQDATTYLGDVEGDPYAEQYSDYFTKYALAESWRNHDVHGQFSDGSQSHDGSTYGAWMVHNTRESYYGGPIHADLVVDGIVYNYMVSGHYGAPVPNITHGFDRTWGPQFYYFNKGEPDATIADLRADAAQFADPEWSVEFYDSITEHVPNLIPSSGRTAFEGNVNLPTGAERPIIVLSENGQDFQLNVFEVKSLQYWAEIDASTGAFRIPRVAEGVYRVTIYADGIFGWYIEDDVDIVVSSEGQAWEFSWEEESAGTELWRIGVPDKSAGEYLHGYAPDTRKPLQPEQYRIYWGQYHFPDDFPEGINFHVGESSEAQDLNYIHWSYIPGRANFLHPEPIYDGINNWTITFDLEASQLADLSDNEATFTVQIAGTKTAKGNNKWGEIDAPYVNLPWTVNVNGGAWESTWEISYLRSGSCGVRSGVSCQNTERKFVFPSSHLQEGRNEFVLSLPYNASSVETALLPDAMYVQYDALRLEVS